MNHFEIPYLVIYDEDPMKDHYDDHEKEEPDRRTYNFNKEIESAIDKRYGNSNMLSPDFEGEFSISRNQADKLGKGLAALKHFQGISDNNIPKNLVDLLTRIYS